MDTDTSGLTVCIWMAVRMMGSSPALPGGQSAGGALAGHSPGCGYWDQLLCSAAAAGSPPGGGYHGDQLPCVKLCDREPIEIGEMMQHDANYLYRILYVCT